MKELYQYNAHNSLIAVYFDSQARSSSSSYHLCFSYALKNEAQANLLIQKVQALIRLKSFLRQTVSYEKNQLKIRIHEVLPADISFFNASLIELDELEKELTQESHDISSRSLIKLNIINLADNNTYIALFNIHHLLMDGHSLDQFIYDLNQLIVGNEVIKEDVDSYVKKINKERPLIEDTNTPDANEYLASIERAASQLDKVNIQDHQNIGHYSAVLPEPLMQTLESIARKYGLSIFNILLLAWGIFIAKLTNKNHTLVAYPVNIRNPDKSIFGCFINTLLFPLELSSNDTYEQLLIALHAKMPFFKKMARLKHNYNFHYVISNFAHSYFSKPLDLIIDNEYIQAKEYAQIAHSSISVKYREYQNSLVVSADVRADFFLPCISDTILERFFNFLGIIFNYPEKCLSKITLTFDDERHRLLHSFNQTDRSFPIDKTLIELFEEQVSRSA